jgi:acyl dehydratase
MSLATGTAVPSLTRRIEAADMVAYAGATWDWHRLHYDAGYVATRGLPGPVVDGQFFGALLIEMLQDWLGPRWRPAELAFRFRNLVFAGETVRCEGTVTEASADSIGCDLRVVILGADGAETGTAVAPARARLVKRS